MDRLLWGALGALVLWVGGFLIGHHALTFMAVTFTVVGLLVIGYAIIEADEESGCDCE